jgi:hypothetical protein
MAPFESSIDLSRRVTVRRLVIACFVSILSLFAIPHDSGNASLKVEPFKSLLGDAL